MATMRRHVYFNPTARSWVAPPADNTDLISQFHQRLPFYEPTKLVSLDEVAKEIGVAAVYLKDESSRFGLTSFKILGASWGTFRALVQAFGLSLDTDLATLKQALALRPVTLYTATDGNHGRAVAYMGCLLSTPAVIHVPANMHESTIQSIRLGGAKVVVSTGNYDAAVLDAQQDAQHNGGLLVQDFAFGGYEDIPKVSYSDH
jgi:diaminopropionate ammonia-lyase family